MAPFYEHRQFGSLTVAAIVAILVPVALILPRAVEASAAPGTIVSAVVVAFLLVLLLFSSLTVRVDREAVELRFGIGLIRKRFPTGRIVQATPVRNAWWYGWGIHLTPHGWLYNVSGLDAVELLMGDGRTCRIGTDEPQTLADAIRNARRGH
jgi:hypothetical protein